MVKYILQMKKDSTKEIKETKKDLIKIEEELEGLRHQLKRTLADYQNLEKRVAEDKSEWIKLANKQLLLRLLPAVDNLMLAEKHTQDEGIVLSIKQFLAALENEGVKKIEVIGKEFNPETMECVQTIEGKDGMVTEEVKAGYTLYDRILRPAQVVVGKTAI